MGAQGAGHGQCHATEWKTVENDSRCQENKGTSAGSSMALNARSREGTGKAKVGLESAHTGENSGWDGKGDEAPIVGGRHAAACKFQA